MLCGYVGEECSRQSKQQVKKRRLKTNKPGSGVQTARDKAAGDEGMFFAVLQYYFELKSHQSKNRSKIIL